MAQDNTALLRQVVNHIQDLELRVRELETSLIKISHVSPPKIPLNRAMLRVADGTDWDPGAGAGLYLTIDGGTTWTKL